MDRDRYGHVGKRKVQTEHRDNAGVFTGPSDKQVSVLMEDKTPPVIDYSWPLIITILKFIFSSALNRDHSKRWGHTTIFIVSYSPVIDNTNISMLISLYTTEDTSGIIWEREYGVTTTGSGGRGENGML